MSKHIPTIIMAAFPAALLLLGFVNANQIAWGWLGDGNYWNGGGGGGGCDSRCGENIGLGEPAGPG
jgi:hypothetical protein